MAEAPADIATQPVPRDSIDLRRRAVSSGAKRVARVTADRNTPSTCCNVDSRAKPNKQPALESTSDVDAEQLESPLFGCRWLVAIAGPDRLSSSTQATCRSRIRHNSQPETSTTCDVAAPVYAPRPELQVLDALRLLASRAHASAMTTALVYARSSSSSSRAQSSSRSAPHRSIKVSSRLAPQIYLGHISTANSSAKAVVVKCAGQLQRDATGRLQGPWKEWQAVRQLRSVAQSHRNVVQVFDTFVQRSHVFVVMEHCARGDLLSDLMATQPESHLDQSHALRIVLHLARGLRFLHDTVNLAHRDVSLENVFVTRDGVYKLGDFGLSTRADTRASGCVGKTQYVAPEVVAETSYDPVTADVWSLGILLFMLLTGAPLLEFALPTSPEFQRVKSMGCRGVLTSWEMNKQFSAATLDLLDKMLEFDPAKRLQDMTEVLNHPALLAASRRENHGDEDDEKPGKC